MLLFLSILLTIAIVLLVVGFFFMKYLVKSNSDLRSKLTAAEIDVYKQSGLLSTEKQDTRYLNHRITDLEGKLAGAHRSLELMLERETGKVNHVKTEIGPNGVDFQLTEKKDVTS